MGDTERRTHCAGHEKSTLAINSLEKNYEHVRKELDELWLRVHNFLTVGSFRWTVGGLVFLVCLAVGANWRMLNNIDTNLNTIASKLSYIEGRESSRKNIMPGTIKTISF
jgi:hypothetical protein